MHHTRYPGGCDQRDGNLKKRKGYILADSTKFGQVAPVTFSELDAVDIITTKLKDATFNKYKNIVEVANNDLHSDI